MPTKQGKSPSEYYKNDLAIDQAGNTVVDAVTRKVQDGAGNNTAISLSDDEFFVKPVNDDSVRTFCTKTSGGSIVLSVDTTNSKVLVGASQVAANTQYAYFGIDWEDSSGLTADTHHAIPFQAATGSVATGGSVMGSATSSSFNDTDPATSLTFSTSGHYYAMCYWYVIDNITIDAVHWLHGADLVTGEDTAAHLMAYTVDTGNGSTGGDLSSGVVVADGDTITNAGREQIYYQSMTVQSANVDAGKVILFTFASDTINSDYSINATVKYHIR